MDLETVPEEDEDEDGGARTKPAVPAAKPAVPAAKPASKAAVPAAKQASTVEVCWGGLAKS